LIAEWLGVAARAATLTLVVACAGGTPPRAGAGPTSPGGAITPAFETGTPGLLAMPPSSASELAATRVDARKVPVPSADAPSRGPANAPVTIQVFSDFQCPFCALAAPVVRQIESEFGGSVRVVWRNLPLEMHQYAALAAETALEVYTERGGAAFWHFHDAAFAATERNGLDDAVIQSLAEAEGVDKSRYRAALAAHTHVPKIEADLAAANQAGINGTPAFFVNDYYAVGALPYAEMRAVVMQALRDTGR
jgi:protein-disulfide isomerase